jgi:hypothetical protein
MIDEINQAHERETKYSNQPFSPTPIAIIHPMKLNVHHIPPATYLRAQK